MRYYVFGVQSLSKKDVKMLKKAGVIKKATSRFAQMMEGIAEGSIEESKDTLSMASAYLKAKDSQK